MKPLIFIVGPTGSGKSALAFELAKVLQGEIISVDSMKVFRGMNIGTAKPSPEEMSEIPHHLIDIMEPTSAFSMGEFVKLAEEKIEEVQKRGSWVILEGGTGLYLKALIWGMFDGPPRNERLREKLETFAENYGTEVLHRRLQQIDKVTSERVHVNDQKRIIRALEVYYETGLVLSEQGKTFSQSPRFKHLMYALKWDRKELYQRINQRVLKMMEQGWLEEVRHLNFSEFCSEAKVALGYLELKEYLAGKTTSERSLEIIQQKTRKFAKRQYTWFNNSFPQICWLEGHNSLTKNVSQILKDCQK